MFRARETEILLPLARQFVRHYKAQTCRKLIENPQHMYNICAAHDEKIIKQVEIMGRMNILNQCFI